MSDREAPDHGTERRRRPDPAGRRALFDAPIVVADDSGRPSGREGKEALYSTPSTRAGTAVITCGRCKERTAVSLTDLGLRILKASVWNPFRHHSRWITCPACERRAWCGVTINLTQS